MRAQEIRTWWHTLQCWNPTAPTLWKAKVHQPWNSNTAQDCGDLEKKPSDTSRHFIRFFRRKMIKNRWFHINGAWWWISGITVRKDILSKWSSKSYFVVMISKSYLHSMKWSKSGPLKKASLSIEGKKNYWSYSFRDPFAHAWIVKHSTDIDMRI